MLLAMARRVFCLKNRQKSWQEGEEQSFFLLFLSGGVFLSSSWQLAWLLRKCTPKTNDTHFLSFFLCRLHFGFSFKFQQSVSDTSLFVSNSNPGGLKQSFNMKNGLSSTTLVVPKSKSSNFKAHQPALLCFALLLQEWWWWWYYYLGTS